MRYGLLFLFCAGVVLPPGIQAQPGSNPDTGWRQKIDAAKKADKGITDLREALKIAEAFGESDARLFETLILLARECVYDDDCEKESAGFRERALRMRATIKPADAHYAGLLSDLAGVLSEAERYRDALALYREALAIRERLLVHGLAGGVGSDRSCWTRSMSE